MRLGPEIRAAVLAMSASTIDRSLRKVREQRPFELLGFDTDNDSVFVNETVRDYCRDSRVFFTRCRPWRKNDQAFVEQKNGAIVRRIVGYRRFEGNELGPRKEHFSEATVRALRNIFD